VVWI